jgi:hypothetical protein
MTGARTHGESRPTEVPCSQNVWEEASDESPDA